MTQKDFLFPHLRSLPYFRAFLRAVESSYYQRLPLPSPVYDVGCGDGHFASLTFDRKLDVGLDPWRFSMKEAKKYNAYKSLVEADGAQTPFPSNHFASGLSNSVLEHIPHIDAVLAETARILRPGAPFYFCVPNPRYFSALSLT
ncbi:MAG: methyltransferase type 11, partial [Chloroflexi bacterium]